MDIYLPSQLHWLLVPLYVLGLPIWLPVVVVYLKRKWFG